jgi:hypothetical protein
LWYAEKLTEFSKHDRQVLLSNERAFSDWANEGKLASIELFAAEVAPATRELVAAERARR